MVETEHLGVFSGYKVVFLLWLKYLLVDRLTKKRYLHCWSLSWMRDVCVSSDTKWKPLSVYLRANSFTQKLRGCFSASCTSSALHSNSHIKSPLGFLGSTLQFPTGRSKLLRNPCPRQQPLDQRPSSHCTSSTAGTEDTCTSDIYFLVASVVITPNGWNCTACHWTSACCCSQGLRNPILLLQQSSWVLHLK